MTDIGFSLYGTVPGPIWEPPKGLIARGRRSGANFARHALTSMKEVKKKFDAVGRRSTALNYSFARSTTPKLELGSGDGEDRFGHQVTSTALSRRKVSRRRLINRIWPRKARRTFVRHAWPRQCEESRRISPPSIA